MALGYEALDADDVQAFLDMCDPAIDWIYPAGGVLEYGGTSHGHAGVQAFLDAHDRAEEILQFRVDDLIDGAGTVVARGVFRCAPSPQDVSGRRSSST